jgi:hypothetical protein
MDPLARRVAKLYLEKRADHLDYDEPVEGESQIDRAKAADLKAWNVLDGAYKRFYQKTIGPFLRHPALEDSQRAAIEDAFRPGSGSFEKAMNALNGTGPSTSKCYYPPFQKRWEAWMEDATRIGRKLDTEVKNRNKPKKDSFAPSVRSLAASFLDNMAGSFEHMKKKPDYELGKDYADFLDTSPDHKKQWEEVCDALYQVANGRGDAFRYDTYSPNEGYKRALDDLKAVYKNKVAPFCIEIWKLVCSVESAYDEASTGWYAYKKGVEKFKAMFLEKSELLKTLRQIQYQMKQDYKLSQEKADDASNAGDDDLAREWLAYGRALFVGPIDRAEAVENEFLQLMKNWYDPMPWQTPKSELVVFAADIARVEQDWYKTPRPHLAAEKLGGEDHPRVGGIDGVVVAVREAGVVRAIAGLLAPDSVRLFFREGAGDVDPAVEHVEESNDVLPCDGFAHGKIVHRCTRGIMPWVDKEEESALFNASGRVLANLELVYERSFPEWRWTLAPDPDRVNVDRGGDGYRYASSRARAKEEIERALGLLPPARGHLWTTEEVDGGPVGKDDFYICQSCGASGGPVIGNEPPPTMAPFLAGPALQVSVDCNRAKEQIAAYRSDEAKAAELVAAYDIEKMTVFECAVRLAHLPRGTIVPYARRKKLYKLYLKVKEALDEGVTITLGKGPVPVEDD